MPKVSQKGNQGESHRKTRFIAPHPLPDTEKPPLICGNPECPLPGREFRRRWARTEKMPQHCSRACWKRHLELRNGKCARVGCQNYRPSRRMIYCSEACYMLVVQQPRRQCARTGCENMTKVAHAIYCSNECRELCIDYKNMSEKAQKVVVSYKEATGHVHNAVKRTSAVRKNNMTAPPRRKMHREAKAYGYLVIFDPEGQQYRACTPEVAGIIARHKTKKGALLLIRQQLRDAGLATLTARKK